MSWRGNGTPKRGANNFGTFPAVNFDPEEPNVFISTSGASKAWWFLVAGIGLVVLSIAGFFASLFGHSGMLQMQMMCTIPMVLAVGCFGAAYTIARAPRQVSVDESGVTIASSKASRLLAWDQISWADTVTQAVTNRKVLKIFGNDGKTLTSIPPDLDGFEDLCELVKEHVAENPSPHQMNVRWRKARRQGTGLIIGAIVACALACTVGWMAWDEHRSAELLKNSSVRGEGVVESKTIAPDGTTHRIEYRVTSGSKWHVHNVQILVPLWEAVKVGDKLPVKTVPDHPEVSEIFGEMKDNFRPSTTVTAVLSVLVFLMGIVFLVAGILSKRGVLVDFDPVTRKFKIDRLVKA
jgi:hypothetical protein